MANIATATATNGGRTSSTIDEIRALLNDDAKTPDQPDHAMFCFEKPVCYVDSDESSNFHDKLSISFGSKDNLNNDGINSSSSNGDEKSISPEQLLENLEKFCDDDDICSMFSKETSTSTLASDVSIKPTIRPIAARHPIVYDQTPFLERLRMALSQKDIAHIFCWVPDGLTFVVINRDEFRRKVLPEFFTQTNIPSFRKQLLRYEFERVSSKETFNYVRDVFHTTDFMAFSHPFFMRDDRALESLILKPHPY